MKLIIQTVFLIKMYSFAIYRGDDIPCLKPRLLSSASLRHAVQLTWVIANASDYEYCHYKREKKIKNRSCSYNGDSSPDGFRGKELILVKLTYPILTSILPSHNAGSSKRQKLERKKCSFFLEFKYCRTKSKCELAHRYSVRLCDYKMSELVNDYNDAENNNCDNNIQVVISSSKIR